MRVNVMKSSTWTAASWENRNRITYSILKDCSVENYDAPTYSIKYVWKGTEHYYLNKKKYSVGEKKFLLVNGSEPVDIEFHSNKNVEGFCIHLSAGLLKEVYRTLLEREDELLSNPFKSEDIPVFESLIYSDQENELGRELHFLAQGFDPNNGAIEVNETGLYYQLCQQLLEIQNRFPPGTSLHVLKNSTRQELLSRLNKAKEMIESAGSENMCIEKIARTALLSASHLYRCFKKVYGQTPYQYMLEVKLKKAADLIHSGQFNLTEIALKLGFADLPSFSKQFRKRYGCAPGRMSKESP